MPRAKFTLLFLLIPLLLHGEDYSFDAESLRHRSEAVRSALVPVGSDYIAGVSLLEVLPLMEDVWEMTIRSAGGGEVLKGDDLAEDWAEVRLLNVSGGLDLVFRGRLYRGIEGLDFSGTPLESRAAEIWISWEGIDELRDEIAYFAALHGLDIRTVEVPNPESKLVAVVRARGDVPDIVMLQSSAVENLVRNRAVQALDYLRLPSLLAPGTDAFTLEGRLWGVPFYYDTQLVFFNPSLVSPPDNTDWTLEDMESLAGSIRGGTLRPMAWNAYSSNWLIPFQMAFGKERLIDSDGGITVDDDATLQALEYILDLIGQGLLVPMERDAMDAEFIAGRVGLIMAGSYSIPYFESLGLDFGVLPYPVNGVNGRRVSPLLDFKAFCISRRASSPILARRIVQFLEGAGVQQRFCPALAKLPGRIDVLGIPGVDYGHLEALEASSEDGTVIPPQRIYAVYKNTMWKLLRFALSGRMSPRRTLEQGQALMNNANE